MPNGLYQLAGPRCTVGAGSTTGFNASADCHPYAAGVPARRHGPPLRPTVAGALTLDET